MAVHPYGNSGRQQVGTSSQQRIHVTGTKHHIAFSTNQ